ncbi:hypothetical protein Pta02_34450 [Planobispora takensis]|uniref:Uncharacterized protein n=1 Tax=Planobispora takensis TaxID=1367882 RepID=A0A8J3SY88_9ACTN|nr:hypothetical protein Pta02_34450 [Planobispora takensis]
MFPQDKVCSRFAPALAMHAGRLCRIFSDENRQGGLYCSWSEGVDEKGQPAPWSEPQWTVSAGLPGPERIRTGPAAVRSAGQVSDPRRSP